MVKLDLFSFTYYMIKLITNETEITNLNEVANSNEILIPADM